MKLFLKSDIAFCLLSLTLVTPVSGLPCMWMLHLVFKIFRDLVLKRLSLVQISAFYWVAVFSVNLNFPSIMGHIVGPMPGCNEEDHAEICGQLYYFNLLNFKMTFSCFFFLCEKCAFPLIREIQIKTKMR